MIYKLINTCLQEFNPLANKGGNFNCYEGFQILNVNSQKNIINGCCIFRQDILDYDKIITNVLIYFLESLTNSEILCKFILYKNEQYNGSFIPLTLFFKLHIKQQWKYTLIF